MVEQTGEPEWIALGHPSYVWRFGQDRRLALIRRFAPLEDRWILDVGCGIGTYVRKFRAFTHHAFGVDIAEERVRSGSRDVPNLYVSTSEDLPFPDASFDVVILNEVIEHVTDDKKTIAECVRVLRPGGRVAIYAPNRLYLFETHGIFVGRRFIFRLIPFVNWLPDILRNRFCPHVRAYTRGGLRRLFDDTPARIVHHGYVYPGFDNIVVDHPHLGRMMRQLFYALEGGPMAMFGLSHFLVAERVET